MSTMTIVPRDLYEIRQAGRSVELIDVRTPVEFCEAHIGFARNVPLDQLDEATIAAGRSGMQEPLYVVCQSGSRGKRACDKLSAAGCTKVVNVEGGTQAWIQADLPIVRGEQAISLERQVRIAAGSLVLIGSLLGYFAHPYWMALPAFVGAGLAFAGITDTCGMGMLLAKMPWNQICRTDTKSAESVNCGVKGGN